MQFKVGDRVEVLKPADGLIGGRANNLGLGIVEDVDAFQVRVKVEANDQAWWYDIESVRPLTPATTLEKPYPHEYPKPTPTPPHPLNHRRYSGTTNWSGDWPT